MKLIYEFDKKEDHIIHEIYGKAEQMNQALLHFAKFLNKKPDTRDIELTFNIIMENNNLNEFRSEKK